jgi:hypothetical protein
MDHPSSCEPGASATGVCSSFVKTPVADAPGSLLSARETDARRSSGCMAERHDLRAEAMMGKAILSQVHRPNFKQQEGLSSRTDNASGLLGDRRSISPAAAWWLRRVSTPSVGRPSRFHPSHILHPGVPMVRADFLHSSTVPTADRGLEYLLLGDLRQLLEEPPSRETRRWLLAVLDRLLAGRSHLETPAYLPLGQRWTPDDFTQARNILSLELISQLQRLRDRVAHGAPFQFLAHELRTSLQRAMTSPCAACRSPALPIAGQ